MIPVFFSGVNIIINRVWFLSYLLFGVLFSSFCALISFKSNNISRHCILSSLSLLYVSYLLNKRSVVDEISLCLCLMKRFLLLVNLREKVNVSV